MYNGDVLDMFEAVLAPESAFLSTPKAEMLARLKSLDFAFKPVFVAVGDVFEEDADMGRLRNFFNDFFYANDQKSLVSLANLFKVVVVLVGVAKDRFRLLVYRGAQAAQAGEGLPAGFEQVLPAVELLVKRKVLANEQQFKAACARPRLTKSAKQLKNLEGNRELGQVFGRVHVRQQNLKSLKLKFSKKIRKAAARTAKAKAKPKTAPESSARQKAEAPAS